MTEWRQVVGFEDYEVSEYGEVRRIRPAKGSRPNPYLRGTLRVEDGYTDYVLRRDGRSFHRKAHRLVAEAFLGPKPFPKAEICHADGSRSNHHYSNLRWDTSAGNKADKVRHGTYTWGEQHPASKLTAEQVESIPELRRRGLSQREIGMSLGVSQTCVSKIERGLRWKGKPANQRPEL